MAEGNVTIKWYGDQAVRIIKDRTKHGVSDAADAVAEEAKARVPINSGELRDSIHVENDPLDAYVAEVVADAPYAIFVELGTKDKAAHPFLRTAVDAALSKILSAFEEK